MPAFGIGPDLRFVERHEGMFARRPRHGFGSAEEIARFRRFDPFLAGDERDRFVALQLPHPVIDLARQQPQRKAHHARRMGAHAFDGEVGLAGIGGAKHRAHPFITPGTA
jgi:hypothetical protein